MKNKVLISSFVVFMIISVVSMGLFVKNKNESLNQLMEDDKISIEKEDGVEIIEEDEKIDFKEGNSFLINKQILASLTSFNFREAHDYIYSQKVMYEASTVPESLELKFHETAIMSKFEEMLSHKDTESVISAIKGFKDVDNYLMSVLYLSRQERLYIIKSVNSINPVIDSSISDLKMEIMDNHDEIKNEIVTIKNIEKIYKHEFKLDESLIWSYIAQTDKGFEFIKMEQVGKSNEKHHTIREWDALFK